MNKTLPILAFFAAISLAGVLPASAQFTGPTPPTTPEPECQINCGGGDDPVEVGEPFNPPKPHPQCKINCDPMEDPDNPEDPNDPNDPNDPGKPGKPGKPGSGQVSANGECGDKLGRLRRVTPDQIKSVSSDSLVDVVPVCRAKSLAAVQDEVATLRAGIAGNEVLDRELGREGYDPSNVVGVIVNGPAVTLYVHKL